MNNEISPTPWGCSVKEDKRVVIEDFLEFPVGTTPDPQLFAEDMEIPAEEGRELVLANAEHIVRCVNLHDDLVDALEWIEKNSFCLKSEMRARSVLEKCRSEVK